MACVLKLLSQHVRQDVQVEPVQIFFYRIFCELLLLTELRVQLQQPRASFSCF
jgi:hypothetical protein